MLVLGIETSCDETAATVVGVVVDRTRCALKLARKRSDSSALRTLGLVGGVAANARHSAGLTALAAEEGCRMVVPPPSLCTDNGAMFAWAGLQYLVNGRADPLTFSARACWPLDADAAPDIGSGRPAHIGD
jgi:N6-L-threonylcarbamoyladenine synthase